MIVGYLLLLMALTTSILLIPGEKYHTLTTSDSGWFYDITVDIAQTNGMVENNGLSHAPYGMPVSITDQGQPLMAAMLYKAVHAISPDVTPMDVVQYWSLLLFALTLIPIFLIGKELGGDLAGCLAAFFATVLSNVQSFMSSPIYWMKVGAFDREASQLILGAWIVYLTIRLFKAPRKSIPTFAILAGSVFGIFGLTWGAGALYLAPVIIGGLILVLLAGFIERFVRRTAGLIKSAFLVIRENLYLIAGTVGMLAVTTILLYVGGGVSPSIWAGFFQTLLGYVGIGGGGGVSFPRYAGEQAAPSDWGETLYSFYFRNGVEILSIIVLVLIAFALIKICLSRKRWELLTLSWLVVLAAMVWPGSGQTRFVRLWWILVPVLAGVGFVGMVSMLRQASLKIVSVSEWLDRIQKPLVIAICAIIVATPFIQNAYATADVTTPPTGSGLDEALIGACEWLKENTPENSIVAITWSYGHLLTGVSRRASVCDGTETLGEIGKTAGATATTLEGATKDWTSDIWKDAYVEIVEGTGVGQIRKITANTTIVLTISPAWATIPDTTSRYVIRFSPIRPPDYIYYVRDGTGYIYGVSNEAPARPWEINGRRTDVERLPVIGEGEFRWLMQTYRDNYGCKIDYVVFINYGAWYPAWDMWSDGRWKARALSFKSEDYDTVFEFENQENVVLDYYGDVFLQADQRSLAGYTVVYVNQDLRIVGFDARYLSPTPDISETLLLFYYENGEVLTLQNGIYAYLLDLPIPMLVNVFSSDLYGTDYLEGINYPVQVVYTSSNSQVKVCKVNYVPQPISVNNILSDNARINDNTPTFRWSSAIGAAKYELWVDDDPTFTSPEIIENTFEVTYTPAENNALTGENYYWKVRAYGADNNATDWSPIWTFTIDTITPSTPSLTSPENDAVENSLTQIFTWTQPEPDAAYRIQIDNEASFTPDYVCEDNAVSDNSYTYTFPRNGTYYWRVCARDVAHNWSSWSENYKLTVLVPPGQPELSSPANLTNDNTPTFEWTIGFNADNHRLLVDNDNDFSSPIENRLFGATDGTYIPADENSLPDGSYSWKVIAINEVGENESTVLTFTIDTVPPAVPELLAPENGQTLRETTPTFDWLDVSDPSGVTYTLDIATDAEFTSPVLTNTRLTGLTESSYLVTAANALPNGMYYWRVKAIDGANNAENFSPVWSFTINTEA